jgi:hypothetical protein
MAEGFDGSAPRGLPDSPRGFPPALARLIVFAERVAEGFAALREKAAPALFFLAEATDQIQNSPPIDEYEAYFIETGHTPSEARLLTLWLTKLGKVLRQENLAEPKLSDAVRSVAKAEGATTLVIRDERRVLEGP